MDQVRAEPSTPPARSMPGMGDHPSATGMYAAIVTALDDLCAGQPVQTLEGRGLVNDLTPSSDSVLQYVLKRGHTQCRYDARASVLISANREGLFDEAIDAAGKAVAAGFKVSATAPDGVIEAIEDPSLPFCLGVQWHPENFFRTGEFRPLFEGFLEASSVRP